MGVRAEVRKGLHLSARAIKLADGRIVASYLWPAPGQTPDELEQDALQAWGPLPPGTHLETRDLTGIVLAISLLLLVPLYLVLDRLTQSPLAMALFVGTATVLLAAVLTGHSQLRVPALGRSLGELGVLVAIGGVFGVAIARQPYDAFFHGLRVNPNVVGLDWHSVAVAEAPLLGLRLCVFALIGFGVLVLFESMATECKPGHCFRWRNAALVVVALVLGVGMLQVWHDAKRAGTVAAAEVLRTGRPPSDSPWLRELDVMAVQVLPPGSMACTETSNDAAAVGLLLGRDGDELQLMMKGTGAMRRERRAVGSVVLCEDVPPLPLPAP